MIKKVLKATSLQEFITAKIIKMNSKKIFFKSKEKSPKTILDNYLINSLYSWSDLKGRILKKQYLIYKNWMKDFQV